MKATQFMRTRGYHSAFCYFPHRRRRGRGKLIPLMSAVMLALAWGLPAVAYGGGFALVQQGTAAMAQGNAFVAEANDPSAIYYNPAGINQLTRPEVYAATFLNYPDHEFHGSDGTYSVTRPRLLATGSFYAVYPANDHVALGLGYFSPFGLSTDWPSSWAGHYITTYSSLKTYTVNPVISLKLTKNFSVAGGADFLWSDVRLRRNTPLLPFVDGKSDMSGAGNGIGANFGALYEPVEGVKIGASYRSLIAVHYEGNLELSLPNFVQRVPRQLDGSANLTLPPSMTFGVCVSRFKPFTFDIDATWTGWSTYSNLDLMLSRAIPVSGRPASAINVQKDWHDAWALRFGGNWQVNDYVKLRAGYTYDMTPVPGPNFDPQVPDSNRHILAVGGDLKLKWVTLGIAYNLILNETRYKDNTYAINGIPLPLADQANGKYQSITHTLGLSSSFRF